MERHLMESDALRGEAGFDYPPRRVIFGKYLK
jgi:hypothetical protein